MGFDKEASSSSHVLQVSALPREDTPLIANSKHLSSNSKTFATVFIAIVGAKVLSLPYTFMRTGWAMGLLELFAFAFLTYHCMMLLIHTRWKLESLNGCYSKIASLGFAVCGPVGRFAVDFMIILSQAGFCISYLIFIANTFAYLFNSSPTNTNPKFLEFSLKSLYIWGCFPFQWTLCRQKY